MYKQKPQLASEDEYQANLCPCSRMKEKCLCGRHKIKIVFQLSMVMSIKEYKQVYLRKICKEQHCEANTCRNILSMADHQTEGEMSSLLGERKKIPPRRNK